MFNRNENQDHSLKSWATGKLAMFAIGLAAGYFIYKTGLIQKLTSKLFNKEKTKDV